MKKSNNLPLINEEKFINPNYSLMPRYRFG